jgi:hypothetical protein
LLASLSLTFVTYTTRAIADDRWHHIVVTRSGVSLKAYPGAVSQLLAAIGSGGDLLERSAPRIPRHSIRPAAISDVLFQGDLDDDRISSRLLAAPEVVQLHDAVNPNIPPAPAGLSAVPGRNESVITWPAIGGATFCNLSWSTISLAPDQNAAHNVIRGVTNPYTHPALTPGMSVYYMVTAVNGFGESAGSSQTTATAF